MKSLILFIILILALTACTQTVVTIPKNQSVTVTDVPVENQTNSTPAPPPIPEGQISILLPRNGNLSAFVPRLSTGQVVLIITPGNQTILINGGIEDDAVYLNSFIRDVGVGKIDYVIATGGAEQHVGGLPFLMSRFNPDLLYFSGIPTEHNLFLEYPINKFLLPSDETITIGGVVVKILTPYKDSVGFEGDINDNALVVRLIYGSESWLIMNDCTSTCQAHLDADLDVETTLLFLPARCEDTSLYLLNEANPRKLVYGYPEELCHDVMDKIAYINVPLTQLNEGELLATTDGLETSVYYKP